MTILKISAASVLVAAALCSPAQSDILGKVGGVASDAVSSVNDAVDQAVGGAGGNIGGGGSVGGSADVAAGGGSAGLGGNARASAGVKGVAAASACVGVNAPAGCGGSAAGIKTPTSSSAGQAASPTAAAKNTSAVQSGGGGAAKGSPDWLVGMIAYGSDNVMLGRIQKVSAAKNDAMPMITVQLDSKRRVQLRNAIQVIKTDGVWLLVPAGMVDSRASGRMTRLSLQ